MDSPNDFFNLISSETKKVLLNCQKIARDTNSTTGTDHLLLALLVTPQTKTQIILQKIINSSSNLEMILKIDKIEETRSNKNVTKEFREILKLAADNKIGKSENHINPEDLLLAIVEYKNCKAFKILKKLNIDTNKLADDLYAITVPDANLESEKPTDLFQNDMFSELDEGAASEQPFDMPQNPFFIQNPQTREKKISYLEEFGTNLTKLAQNNKLDNIVGREKESDRIIQILCRRTKNNPVLVGEPGVGKTAIVEGLAQRIVSEKVPQKLIGKSIIVLDLAMAVAGTMYRGQYEARIKKIIKEAKNNPDIILFIDEIHTMIGTGSAEGSMDTANLLKPSLAKGEIRLIGATTFEEYRKYIEKDTALERRLQKITVHEPSIKDCKKILESTKLALEKFHNVVITRDAIDSAIDLSMRYISDKHLPDKAIDILDEASASIHLENQNYKPQNITKYEQTLATILADKEEAIEKENFPQAAFLRTKELKIKAIIEKLHNDIKNISKKSIIDEAKIALVVSNMAHIPVENISKDNLGDIKNLSTKITHFIVGQNEAVEKIVSSIKKTKTKLSDPQRPLGSFIFLGPTGVGKTELAKILAKIVYGSEKKLIKIDMSEFMERHNVSRLVGAPPGYVGYDDAGKLTESVRNNPYSIILLDEIEKAHPEVFNILLQIMEDGYLTDAKGRKVNFRSSIIIMTSNIGMSDLQKHASIGFNDKLNNTSYDNIKEKIFCDLKKTFKPEFINRLDNVIIFHPLEKKAIHQIVKLKISEIVKRAKKQNIKLKLSPAVIGHLAQKSYNPEYGAREVRRVIEKFITNIVADKIIDNSKTKIINISLSKNKIVFDVK